MRNQFGNSITITLFGESHGPYVGAVVDGLPHGFRVNRKGIEEALIKRRGQANLSTKRKEKDKYQIISGLKDDITEGTPLCVIIPNVDVRSKDYDAIKDTPRPSHADCAAMMRYEGYNDYRGGGHFSGRLTTPIVIIGEILRQMLMKKNIIISSHIKQLYDVKDECFKDDIKKQITKMRKNDFPVIDKNAKEKMIEVIGKAIKEKDSVGGILETAIINLPVGLGEPFFSSFEGELSKALFSIPAVKGVSFGLGFGFADVRGSEANDAFKYEKGAVITTTNHNGGINGGLTNGMPVIFDTVIKPTASIALEQDTVNLKTKRNTKISIQGRHDAAIITRAYVVVESISAFVVADFLATRYGEQWLEK